MRSGAARPRGERRGSVSAELPLHVDHGAPDDPCEQFLLGSGVHDVVGSDVLHVPRHGIETQTAVNRHVGEPDRALRAKDAAGAGLGDERRFQERRGIGHVLGL